jgi:hypothetical protein
MVVEKRAAKEQRTIKIFEKEKIQLLSGLMDLISNRVCAISSCQKKSRIPLPT